MSNVTLGKVAILKRDTFYVDGVEVTWIPGYEERYAISKDGKVWSEPIEYQVRNGRSGKPYTRRQPGKWIKASDDKEGYKVIALNRKQFRLHRVLAMIYIYNPDKTNRTVVDHENRDIADNRLENLRWLTIWENDLNKASKYGVEAGDGTDKKAERKRAKAKETPEQAEERRKRRNAQAAERRRNLSPEELEEVRRKDRERKRAKYQAKKAEAGEKSPAQTNRVPVRAH